MGLTSKPRICVIGAGISGMSCAYRLQTELPNVEVTVVADKFTPHLTSDGAAGIWEPYDFFNTDPAKIKRWSLVTYDHLKKLALSPDMLQAGVSFLKLNVISVKKIEEAPWYAKDADHYRPLTMEEIKRYDINCKDGYSYTTMTCSPSCYLPWTHQRFLKAGGVIMKQKVTDLSKVCDNYDLVVNCTGLAARELANDTLMVPIKGQIVKVKGVTILSCIVHDETERYIIPGRDFITLGGTFEVGNADTEICEETKKKIIEGVLQFNPSLKNAKFVADWCGLRPSRKDGVRLEVDTSYHSTTKVIHNYGHGGIGVTLHWGCAEEVVGLARPILNVYAQSKL